MIRVLVVDDSALVRRVLARELSRSPDIEVVGEAGDPYAARESIATLRPDVITLDLEMPRMDGLSFLDKLMRHFPIPVVVVSSLAPRNSDVAVRALALGAVDVICKPDGAHTVREVGQQLVRAVRAAAAVDRARLAEAPATPAPARHAPGADPAVRDPDRVIAIGASTGGTQAIEAVLRDFPPDAPGTVVVQHMPEGFTASFARRLNGLCAMEVREARDGEPLAAGVALIAPGGRHMILEGSPGRARVRIRSGPPVHHQRPAVDVLFGSVARCVGPAAAGALLTGMGSDGAKGLLAMREAGGFTLAQDERSCVVFGMPREAIRLDAARVVLPLERIGAALLSAAAVPAAAGG